MKRLFTLIGLLTLLSLPLYAREAARGFCETGGVRTKTSGQNSSNFVQGSFPTCTVTVRLVSNNAIATIYADNAGTPLSNPFTATSQGFWIFYADNNRYTVTLTGGSITGSIVIPDILLNDGGSSGSSVSSVFGRIGTVVAQSGDYTVSQVTGAAPIASPTFTGTVTLPIVGLAQCLQVSTTGAIQGAGAPCGTGSSSSPIASVFGRTGVITAQAGDYSVAQVTGAAPLASPVFTGTPVAPTAAFGTSTTQLATTAFVQTALSLASSPVTSVFGRLGAVAAQTGDYSVSQVTGAAALASPVFTGDPQAPTPSTGDNDTSIATTAFVKAQGYLTSGVTGSGTTNKLPKFTGASVIGDSLLTDTANLLTYTGTNGLTSPKVDTSFVTISQGSAQATVANKVGFYAPVSVTAYNLLFPSAASTGFVKGTNSSNIVTLSFASSINLATDVSGTLPVGNLCAGTPVDPTNTYLRGDCTWGSPAGAGTVTSVALTVPSGFSVSGSPVTGSGTLAVTYGSVNAHLFLGNNTGAPATAAFVQPAFGDLSGTATTGQLPYTYGGNTTKLATIGASWTGVGAIPCLDASGNLVTSGCTTGTVTSVFTRTGAVTAQTGDYSLSQITATFSSPLSLSTNTLSCPTCVTSAASLTSGQLMTGAGSQASQTNANWSITVGTLTAGASGVLDLSAAATTAGFKVPVGAGAVPTADGTVSVNSTTHALVHGSNGTTLVSAVAATGTGTATTCTNQVITAVSGIAVPTCTSLTTSFLPAAVVLNNAANTGTAAMTLDMSASTSAASLRVPNIAGASSTTAGVISYDTTNKMFHGGANGVDNRLLVLPSSITPANDDCVKFTVAAGVITLNTAGAACGSGGGGSGTVASSTIGTVAVYTGATTVTGNSRFTDSGTVLSYTGSGGFTTDTGGGVAGYAGLGQGSAQSIVANTIGLSAPTSVTGYNILFPAAAASGILKGVNAANIMTMSFSSIDLSSATDVGASVLGFANGGTNATTRVNAVTSLLPTATRAGDVLYWDGAVWNHLAGNNVGVTFLSENASGVPSWSTGTASINTGAAGNVPYYAAAGTTLTPDVISYSTLTDGATITFAAGSAPYVNRTVTLGGNRTLNLTGLVNGGQYSLIIKQDATGSRTLALGTGCTWKVSGNGGGAITLTTAGNSIDVLAWTYDGTNCYANISNQFN